MAAFKEVLPEAGVDEDRKPNPGMIIPIHGENLVRLEGGSGYKPGAHPGLEFVELKPKDAEVAIKALAAKLGRTVPLLPAGSVVFRVKATGAPRGLKVKVTKRGATPLEATLEVTVVKPRTVKLAIRPLQGRDATETVVLHTKEPADPATLKAVVKTMNSIWTPQTAVQFDLVSSSPFMPDGKDIAEAMGVKAPEARLPDRVDFPTFAKLFDGKGVDGGAEFGMFLVHLATDSRSYTDAVTSSWDTGTGKATVHRAVSLISDTRKSLPDVFAHEAGHLLGHRGESDIHKELMHAGGSDIGSKIPYEDTVRIYQR